MVARLQNASRRAGLSIRRAVVWAIPGLLLLLPLPLRAQTPPWTIARITGDDLSVAVVGGTFSPQDSRTIFLASGSEITVHSGQARLEFINGGVIGICGPAKLKLLESGGAFTVAMDFGRLHLLLDGAMPLTIYTPLVLAVPQGIEGGPRDATIGLDLNGEMCVRAAHGGVRLQQQFSGDTMIVPEPLEIFVNGPQLRLLPGAPGSCQCEVMQASTAPPLITSPANQETAANTVPATAPAPRRQSIVKRELSAVAKPAEKKPEEKKAAANHPATEVPVWKVLMPPLLYDATSPNRPWVASEQTILLVREVRVEPDWIFHGRIEPRARPAARMPAPPAARVRPSTPAVLQPADGAVSKKLQKQKKKESEKDRDLFRRRGGSPCAGVGCGG